MSHGADHEHGRGSHDAGEAAHGSQGERPGRNQPLPPGSGEHKLLFVDAFSGISGDMMVAALVDLGVPTEVMKAALEPLPLTGYELQYDRVQRSGIEATRFRVEVASEQPSRDWAAIRAMLEGATHLPRGAQQLALRAFELLARAEAEVHGTSPDRVHFHEVGAVDSIVDVVAAAVGLDHLGARVIGSPLPMGRGLIRTRHGAMPSPAPATVLCLRGIPTHYAGIDAELVTPTGASLLATAASGFSRWPSIEAERVGWGAGSLELEDRPNLLRLVLGSEGDPKQPEIPRSEKDFLVLEANLDDMSGELCAVAVGRLLEAGALDAWVTPIGMKKGRPAVMISALARGPDADRVARTLLSETSTLGLRLREVKRIERPRRMVEVQTPYGKISVKVADGDGLPPNVAPEFEQCRLAAEKHSVPVKQVMQAAVSAFAAREGR
jgi:uncharacterized protein (TIGR00299 family) protein